MIDVIKEQLIEHAKTEYPRECCGVVVVFKGRYKYVACRNISEYISDFDIHPEDIIAAEELGEIVAICHSHPNAQPEPSQADLVGCEVSGIPWIIVGYPNTGIKQIEPCGYKAPLIGRKFVDGVHDCYGLARDYYKETLNINLPNPKRCAKEVNSGKIITLENIEAMGFNIVDMKDMREHDAILMQNASDIINHIAVYLGNNIILHQCLGRVSSKDVYGGYWLKNTRYAVRHKSLC